jgi:hypothetical protein
MSSPKALDAKLDQLRLEFDAGSQPALAKAILVCGEKGVLLPGWVVTAWRQGCDDVRDRKVKGWDDVLANGKRKTLKQLRREYTISQKLRLVASGFDFYDSLTISNNRTKKDSTFAVIAKHLTAAGKFSSQWTEVSWSAAKGLFYEVKRQRLQAGIQPGKLKQTVTIDETRRALVSTFESDPDAPGAAWGEFMGDKILIGRINPKP